MNETMLLNNLTIEEILKLHDEEGIDFIVENGMITGCEERDDERKIA